MTRGLLLATLLLGGLPGAAYSQIPPAASVVVLPLDGSAASPGATWLREGLALLLADAIAAQDIDVVARDERVAAFERLQLPVGATLSRASTVRVGQAIGAGVVVVGRVELEGDQLHVSARAIRLDTGRLMPEVEDRAPLTDLFGVAARIAGRLVGTGSTPPTWSPPPSLAAFELYAKGLVADSQAAERTLLEQALKAAPTYDTVRLTLWQLHTEQGEPQRALDVVTPVRAGSPLEREARFAAAMSLIRLKRFDEAFTALRTLQASTPLAAVSNAIGVVQLGRGSTPQNGGATYYFNQATEIDASEPDYFFNLGYAYWLEKDANAAAYWLREAVRRDPTDGDAHFVLSAALQQAGAAAEAARERELATRLSSRYLQWESRASTGGELIPRGLERLRERLDAPSARVDLRMTASGQRDQAALAAFHLDAARRAFDRELDREAEQELRRALHLSPYLAEAQLLLGRVYLRGGREEEAIQALKVAVWSEPSPIAHAALAEAYLAIEDPVSARAEVERALALDPGSPEALRVQRRLPPR